MFSVKLEILVFNVILDYKNTLINIIYIKYPSFLVLFNVKTCNDYFTIYDGISGIRIMPPQII